MSENLLESRYFRGVEPLPCKEHQDRVAWIPGDGCNSILEAGPGGGVRRLGGQTSSRAGTLPAAARTTGLAIPEFRDRSRTWGERAKPCGLHPGPHGPCSLPLHSLLLLPLSILQDKAQAGLTLAALVPSLESPSFTPSTCGSLESSLHLVGPILLPVNGGFLCLIESTSL